MFSALVLLSTLALADEEEPPPEPPPPEEVQELVESGLLMLLGTTGDNGGSIEDVLVGSGELDAAFEAGISGGAITVASEDAARGAQTRGLAVGVNRFADSTITQLTYAVPDAWAFRSALIESSQGAWNVSDFPVLADEAATKDRVLEELERVLLEANDHDTVVLFFSTHGSLHEGEGYLYAHDSDFAGLSDNGVPMSSVSRLIDESPAKHVLLFTDACHSGAMGSGVTRGEDGFNKVLDSLDRAEGSFFSFSSSLVRQQSFEHWGYCGGAGAFTCGIRRALEGEGDLDADGEVTLAELATSVPPIVMQLTDYKQTPEAKGDYDPSIVIATHASSAGDTYDADGYGPDGYGGYEAEVAGILGSLGTYEDAEGYGGLGVVGGLVGESGGYGLGTYEEGYDYSEYDYEDYGWQWYTTFVLALRGGVAMGSVSPTASSTGDALLDAGTAGHSALHFGLSERWWMNPSVFVRGLFTSGSPVSQGAQTDVTRLGFGLRNHVYVLPYATWTPYIPFEAEVDGADWSNAQADATWSLSPFSRTTLGTGLGVEFYPWWSGSFLFTLEASQHLSLAGAEVAPDAMAVAGRPSFTRVSLGVDWMF